MQPEDPFSHLRAMPRPAAAEQLLCGLTGPLQRTAAVFPPVLAKLAYFLYVVRQRAAFTILAGRPQYEGDDTFRHRVTAAAKSSGSLADFGHVLCRRLNLSLAELRTEDLLWWREFSAACAPDWRRMGDRELTEAVTGAQLLRGWAGRKAGEPGWVHGPETVETDNDPLIPTTTVEVL